MVYPMLRRRSTAVHFVAACILASSLLLSCGPKATRQSTPRHFTIDQFMATLKVWGNSFSSDERIILTTTNASGVFNAFAYPVNGTPPIQLTSSTTNSVIAISYFPLDDRILFSSDAVGNENNHLFVRLPDARILDLTPGKNVRADFLQWRHDRKACYYTSTVRNGNSEDLYLLDNASLTSKLIWTNDSSYEIMQVSHNDRFILLLKSNTAEDADAYLVDLQSGSSVRPLITSKAEVNYTPLSFSSDDKLVYFLTNEGSEFMSFESIDLASGKRETLHREPWDVLYGFYSEKGQYRAVLVNRDARVQVIVTDTKTGRDLELPKLPEGDVSRVEFSPSERYMSIYASSSSSPNNLYVYDLQQNTYRQLTHSLSASIRQQDLVSAQVIRYPSFDSLLIPANLYVPRLAPTSTKSPAVIYLHSLGNQSRLTYQPVIQFLANHGYVVLDVNFRGSQGYGKSFYAADNRKHGDADLRDVTWAKRYLGSLGTIDTSKVAVMGGGYGGYLALAGLAFHPAEFAAGIDLFGISNWPETLKNLPPQLNRIRNVLITEVGDPISDAEFLRKKSPFFFAESIRRPLLVVQGSNDKLVAQSLTDDFVLRLRKNGSLVEYLVFADEGHGLYKKANEVQVYGAVLKFLDAHLKSSATEYKYEASSGTNTGPTGTSPGQRH